MKPSQERMVFSMSILETKDLKKYYGTEPNITKALDGVTLTVEQGEFVAIVGTSGSGKSTLLNMICLLYTSPAGFSNAAFSVFPVPAGQWFFYIPALTVPKIFPCSHILCQMCIRDRPITGICHSYTSSVKTISSARLRMLFMRRTHSI